MAVQMHQKTVLREAGFHIGDVMELSRSERFFACFVHSRTEIRCAVGSQRHVSLSQAAGAWEALEAFQSQAEMRVAGYLGYDLKNGLYPLQSRHPDALGMPESVFFEPKAWIDIDGVRAVITSPDSLFAERLAAQLAAPTAIAAEPQPPVRLHPQTDHTAYMRHAAALKAHIQRGDIYEVNYCMQFTGLAEAFDPVRAFVELYDKTEAPFSVFAKLDGHHVLSASPERFLRNQGGRLSSQPIKGTVKRSADPRMDEALRAQLRHDPKEQSENVMIVDLVRNDLSRVAARNTVTVPELFGIHSFKTVHHMVSTVEAQLADGKGPWDAIRSCFPMGSMTGAPKLRAMELIEAHETFKRGCYSGAFGWVAPDGDFDFNVVIRTLLYDASSRALALAVGSALTDAADPQKEYEECLLKAQALLEVLNPTAAIDGVGAAI